MKGFVQQLLLYALIEGKHAGRYDLNRIRSPAVAIDLVGEAVLRQNPDALIWATIWLSWS